MKIYLPDGPRPTTQNVVAAGVPKTRQQLIFERQLRRSIRFNTAQKTQDMGFLIGMLMLFIFSLLVFYLGGPRLINALTEPESASITTTYTK